MRKKPKFKEFINLSKYLLDYKNLSKFKKIGFNIKAPFAYIKTLKIIRKGEKNSERIRKNN